MSSLPGSCYFLQFVDLRLKLLVLREQLPADLLQLRVLSWRDQLVLIIGLLQQCVKLGWLRR